MIVKIMLRFMLGAVVAFGMYVRLAPLDPQKWHALPDDVIHADMQVGAMRVVNEIDTEQLQQFDDIAMRDRSTQRLAGHPDDGMVTYISRSKFWGFPDYTTARLRAGRLEIYGRLRFGRSDFGVNATRIDRWLRLLAQ